ncbi:MAG: hypothetical protein GF334_03185, partial [Candidatus Altiarchaeales archaeon]|nr:hypothetical protein [Candidatus Altiarchaeales archaeon]
MPVDLDRLHFVVENWPRLYGLRRTGRTYASCQNLAGIIATAQPGEVIIYPLPIANWIYHISAMVNKVLTEQGIPVWWRNQFTLESGGVFVYFRVCPRQEDLYFATRGADYIVDTFGEYEE